MDINHIAFVALLNDSEHDISELLAIVRGLRGAVMREAGPLAYTSWMKGLDARNAQAMADVERVKETANDVLGFDENV